MNEMRIPVNATNKEKVARYQAVCQLRIGQVGQLAHLFGYAGVDEDNLATAISRVDHYINNLSQLIGEDHDDLLTPVIGFLNETRRFLTDAERCILRELSEGGAK